MVAIKCSCKSLDVNVVDGELTCMECGAILGFEDTKYEVIEEN